MEKKCEYCEEVIAPSHKTYEVGLAPLSVVCEKCFRACGVNPFAPPDVTIECTRCGKEVSPTLAHLKDGKVMCDPCYEKGPSVLADIGGCALGAVIPIAGITLVTFFLMGGVSLAPKVLPWLIQGSAWALGGSVLLFVPLAAFRSTRPWAGLGLVLSSYVFGLTTWFLGLLNAAYFWGLWAVIVGMLLLGVGVVPVGILAASFNGAWTNVLILVLGVVVTFGMRGLGLMLIEAQESS